MTTPPAPARRRHWRISAALFAARPNLMIAMAAGVAVGLVTAGAAPGVRLSTSAIAGWDTFCAVQLGLAFRALAGKGPDHIRERSAREDHGQAVILLVILTACAASLVAVAIELSLAKGLQDHLAQARHIAAAVVTVALSWLLMQVVFAIHYAHAYYAADPATGQDARGLGFPGDTPPDYWDFLHFATVIGVAGQTADITFTSQALRRVGTVHGIIAFAFNTLIVALTINLLSGLI